MAVGRMSRKAQSAFFPRCALNTADYAGQAADVRDHGRPSSVTCIVSRCREIVAFRPAHSLGKPHNMVR